MGAHGGSYFAIEVAPAVPGHAGMQPLLVIDGFAIRDHTCIWASQVYSELWVDVILLISAYVTVGG